jgi:hypothetical protein
MLILILLLCVITGALIARPVIHTLRQLAII